MSGSAALSAAKNRRTATTAPTSSPYPSPSSNNKPNSVIKSEGPKNPLQILYGHEMRLNAIENQDNSHANKSTNSGNEELINSLSNKIVQLENKYTTLKDEINKVMMFCMETNRELLNYKNSQQLS
jgi:hypothetical protein